MKKTIVCSLLAAFMVSAMPAFAQFKFPVYGDKNLANLDRVINNAFRPSKILVDVPTRAVEGGLIGLTRAVTPRKLTPVTASLIKYRENPRFKQEVWGKLFNGERIVGAGFYKDATKLALDLDFYYGGLSPVLQRKNGPRVKFYALPVDGILYQPEDYTKPFVLNSKDVFVIYDLENHTGQIMENQPVIYERYKPVEWSEELWQAKPEQTEPKAKKESAGPIGGPLAWRKDEQAAASAQKPAHVFVDENLGSYDSLHQEVTQLRQAGTTESWWQEAGLEKQYTTGNLLGQAVVRFYNVHQADLPALLSVKQVATGKRGDIYELPVEELKIQLKNGNTVNVNPQEVVLFYPQDKAFMLIKRSQLTDGQSFELLLP